MLASTGTATRHVRGDPNSLTFSFDGAINGTCVDILVDSGAYLSFLSEEFYREHLAATKQQATTDVPVTLADGTPYRVNTVVRTKLRINQPYEHPYETGFPKNVTNTQETRVRFPEGELPVPGSNPLP